MTSPGVLYPTDRAAEVYPESDNMEIVIFNKMLYILNYYYRVPVDLK